MDNKEIFKIMISDKYAYYINKASLRPNKCKISMTGMEVSLITTISNSSFLVNNNKNLKQTKKGNNGNYIF